MEKAKVKSKTSQKRNIDDHTVFEVYKPNEHIWEECMKKIEDTELDIHSDIADAFRVFDRNKDGLLCIHDISTMMHNMDERMAEKDIQDFMAYGDRDGDGLINFKDFLKMMLESPLSPLSSQSSVLISKKQTVEGTKS